jgi:RimJ/RimL family protein N-acetyltransferase
MTQELPNELETKRLILRPYKDGDEDHFFEMLQKGNREYLDELLGPISQEKKIEKVKEYLQDLIADWKSGKRFVLSYWDKITNGYLGHIWIEPINWELRIFEVGWFVIQQQQNKGYSTESARTAFAFIFQHLNANKIVVTVRDYGKYKEQSKKIAIKCGCILEGFIRQSVQIITSRGAGSVVGVYHYGLLKSERE